jgi:uncharacterized membrane protein YfcA
MPFAVEALLLVAAGAVIGAYSISIGAGGGFLIAPLLLIRYPDAPPEAITTASLTAVVITSFASSAIVIPERRVDMPVALTMASIAVPAGIIGALGTSILPRTAFALGFAVLLIVLAFYILLRPTSSAPPAAGDAAGDGVARVLEDRDGDRFEYHIPVRRSIAPLTGMAFLSALAGIGGGPIGIPVMTRIMRIPHAIAVPTIQVNIAIMSSVVVLLHVALGDVGDPISDVPFLGLGVLIANPFGQRLRRRLGEGPLMRALAVGLFLVAARTAFGAFE